MFDSAWTRIADDLRATTGRELLLLANETHDPWYDVEVLIDEQHVGAIGYNFSDELEDSVAELADYLREAFLDEEVTGGWPTCPEHHTHPLEANVDDKGIAVWYCPRGTTSVRIGSLTEIG